MFRNKSNRFHDLLAAYASLASSGEVVIPQPFAFADLSEIAVFDPRRGRHRIEIGRFQPHVPRCRPLSFLPAERGLKRP